MFIELVDSLRCLEPHEDTWLVASVSRMDGRHIVEGTLGCPICRREYPIRAGIGWFGAAPPNAALPGAAGALPEVAAIEPTADPERAARAAALLELADGGGIVVLGGGWADCAHAVAELGPAHVVLLNAAPPTGSHQEISALVVDDRLPFALAALRGVALGDGTATAPLLASAVATLRTRGRLVAPAGAPVPDGVTELARDAADWVAERVAVESAPVALRSVRR